MNTTPSPNDYHEAFEVENRIESLCLENQYAWALRNIVSVKRGINWMWSLLHATPEQRCRAALKVVLDYELAEQTKVRRANSS